MHVHIEHWINKTNKIYIILETLRGAIAPQPPQLAPLTERQFPAEYRVVRPSSTKSEYQAEYSKD